MYIFNHLDTMDAAQIPNQNLMQRVQLGKAKQRRAFAMAKTPPRTIQSSRRRDRFDMFRAHTLQKQSMAAYSCRCIKNLPRRLLRTQGLQIAADLTDTAVRSPSPIRTTSGLVPVQNRDSPPESFQTLPHKWSDRH